VCLLTLLANSTIELAVMSAGRLLALRLQVPPSLFQRLPRHEDLRWPNAKSVSERSWQMSHNMKSNAGNVLPALISQLWALQ
jgi:hypothetical protein